MSPSLNITAELYIFCDGACSGNPGPGGFGIILTWLSTNLTQSHYLELGLAYPNTTNNRMELQAAIFALQMIPLHKNNSPHIFSDSQYVIKGATQWLKNWKRKSWTTSEGNPVTHKDLWQSCDALSSSYPNLQWHHVQGHQGHPLNERADHIAQTCSQQQRHHMAQGLLHEHPEPKVIKFFQTMV